MATVYDAISAGVPVSTGVLIRELNSLTDLTELIKAQPLIGAIANREYESRELSESVFRFIQNLREKFPGPLPWQYSLSVMRIQNTVQYPKTFVLDMFEEGLYQPEYAIRQNALEYSDVQYIIKRTVDGAGGTVQAKNLCTEAILETRHIERLTNANILSDDFVCNYLAIHGLLLIDKIRNVIDVNDAIKVYRDGKIDEASSYSFFSAVERFSNLPLEFINEIHQGIKDESGAWIKRGSPIQFYNTYNISTYHDIDLDFARNCDYLDYNYLGTPNNSVLNTQYKPSEYSFKSHTYFQRIEYDALMYLKKRWLVQQKYKTRNVERLHAFIASVIVNALYEKADLSERLEENISEFFELERQHLTNLLENGYIPEAFVKKNLDLFAKRKLKSFALKMVEKNNE